MTEPRPPMHPESSPLSDAGLARKAEILALLHQAAAARRARRNMARRAALAAVAISAGALAVRIWSPAPTPGLPPRHAPTTLADENPPAPLASPTQTAPGPRPEPIHTAAAEPATRSSAPTITILTNADVRLAACPSPAEPAVVPGACLLSDDQLLAALAETGEAYGLIRAGNRVEIVRRSP